MWTRIVLICLVICFATSHPTLEENETSRMPRQLDFEDCCPCPHSKSRSPGASDQDMLADTTGEGARLGDDCPCRFRDADSYGSPSILFPTSMRAERPFLRPVDSKEDPKNLLQPEVGLAKSVLETIRKATSEEYQEALARDAARNAAKTEQDDSLHNDGMSAESGRNVVTIILNPKETDSFDDVMSEASHIKEARCIHPALGSYKSSNLGKMRIPTSQPKPNQTHLMKEIFKFPKTKHTGLLHRNLLDMDSYVGASNVQERVLMGNNRLRNNRPMLKQNIYNNNQEIKLSDNISEVSDVDDYGIHGPLIPERRLESRNNDLDQTPSNKQEKLADNNQNFKETASFRLVPTEKKLLQRPAVLRNLLKLKDVELLPSKISDEKIKFNITKFQLTPLINRKTFNPDGWASKRKSTDLSDLLRNGLKFNLNSRKPINFDNHEEKLNAATSITNIQIISRPADEIVDAIPSPSNIEEKYKNNKILDKDCGNELTESTVENNTHMIENDVMEDTQPSPSEDHLFNIQDDQSKKVYESFDSDATLNNNFVSNSEEIKSPLTGKTQSQDSNEKVLDVSAIREKETSDEESNESDINSSECLEKLNADQDSIAAANNDVQYVLPKEENEPESTSISVEHEIADVKETCDEGVNKISIAYAEDQIKPSALNIKPIPLKETLTTIKENVFKTLDSLKKTTSIKKPDLSKNTKTYSSDENNKEKTEGPQSADDNEVVDLHCDNEESEMEKAASSNTSSTDKPLENSIEDSDSITTRDLQKLSDLILEASTKKEGTITSKSEACDSISKEVENTTEESNEVNQYLDSDTSASSQNEDINTDVNMKNTEENSCITDLGSLNAIQKVEIPKSSSTLSNTMRLPDEMTAEASSILDSVNSNPLGLFKANNNLRSILLPDIVQPSHILNDELNIFGQSPTDLEELFNLKTSLPTLDDIKLQLSSIFNVNQRDASDEMSYEVGYDTDRTELGMATAASTSNFQSKLPSLKRLEDVNLNIFQMKPLTMTHSDLVPKIPRLNLNSYRAKLAIPKTVDLKPIKLQSALGDTAGVLGATLTIIPDKLKVKPLLKSNIDSGRMLPDLLGNTLGSIPSLDEMHDTMRTNVQSLINTPLEKSNSNILHNSLQSSLSLDIPDSIRTHAENTIKDMQRTMKVLKNRPPSDLNNLADTIKTPEDLVELASRTREDVSDKLKALHYDFNDRLTSIRESFIDEPKLSLNAPVFTKNDRKYNTRPKSNINTRKKPSTPRTSQYRKNLPGRRESQNKITSSRNGKLGEGKVKTYKMSQAASVPIPKSVEVPQLKSTSTKSLLPNVRSESNLKPNLKSFEPKQGVSNFARQPAKSAFDFTKSPLNNPGPFHKETKVTISFTTTPRPTSHGSKNTFVTNPEFGLGKGAHFPSKQNTSLKNRANSLGNQNSDIKGSPSELWPSSKSTTMDREDILPFRPIKPTYTTPKPVYDGTQTKPPLLKHLSNENVPSLLHDSIGLKPKSSTIPDETISALSRGSKGGPKISTWPSVSDNTFLSKVREAVRARLTNFKPVLSKDRPDSGRSNFEVDMARSPSENVETILGEPLKENVSYKCKMVCTKE